MSPRRKNPNRAGNRFPRVSGDEPEAGELFTRNMEFSPRERG